MPIFVPKFGTAGLRGVTNWEITPELALSMARQYARYLGSPGRVAIGRDTRFGSGMLARAAAAGFLSMGLDCTDCGCLPTPGLATYIVTHALKGGIMITGSHMPPDRNGIIPLLGDGAYAPASVTDALEASYRADPFPTPAAAEAIGTFLEEMDAERTYEEDLLRRVDRGAIAGGRFRLVVDPANGAAAGVLSRLLSRVGCDVFPVNDDRRPLPARPSEPRAHTIQEAASVTRDHACHLGVATDVDADRVLFIDEKGQALSEDLVGCMFLEWLHGMEPLRRVVCPVNSSGLVEATCRRLGIPLEYCRIGQPGTIEAIKDLGAEFAYEESGKYYFAREVPWPDALLSTLKMLEMLTDTGKTLSALAAAHPPFVQVKEAIPCEERQRPRLLRRIEEAWGQALAEGRIRDVTIDGWKRVYEDDAWLLVRASGTEPLIRVFSDARSRERALDLVRQGVAWVQSLL